MPVETERRNSSNFVGTNVVSAILYMDINLVSISAKKWELRILVAKTIAAS